MRALFLSLLLTLPAFAQADWSARGPSGGFFVEFGFHPTEPSIVYAGSDDSGGLWRTDDGGASWHLLTGAFANETGWAIALDPNQPDTLLVGDVYARHSLLRTTDGGVTWTDPAPQMAGTPVADLVFQPGSSSVVYMATGDDKIGLGQGVLKSTDGGFTWAPTGLAGVHVTRLAIALTGPLWAVVVDGTVRRSVDGGASWSTHGQGLGISTVGTTADLHLPVFGVFPQAASLLSLTPFGLWSMGLPFSYVDEVVSVPGTLDRVLFASTWLGTGLRRSADWGVTWTAANAGLEALFPIAIGAASDGTLFTSSYANEGLWRSLDQGSSWAQVNGGLFAYDATGLEVDPGDSNRFYVTPLEAYSGEDFAQSRRTYRGDLDPATGAVTWTLLPGFEGATLRLSAAPGNPMRLMSGSFERGILWSDDGGLTAVRRFPNHTALAAAFDPDNADLALVSLVDFQTFAVTLARTTDGGQSWSQKAVPLLANELLAEPGTMCVWAAAGDGVWRSPDNGSSWSQMGLAGKELLAIDSHPAQPQRLFAGGKDGRLYKTLDDGAHWTGLVLPGWPAEAEVRAVVVDPLDADHVLVGLNGAEGVRADGQYIQAGGVWESLDGGLTWTDRTSPAMTTSHVWGLGIVGPAGSRRLAAATYGGGVFVRSL
jgi:hypothetical protein